MSCHMMTGNRLDVVYEYSNGKMEFKGLKPWDGLNSDGLIPLRDPKAVATAILKVLEEIEGDNGRKK